MRAGMMATDAVHWYELAEQIFQMFRSRCCKPPFRTCSVLPRLGKGTFLRQLRLPPGLPHGNKDIVWALMLQSQIVTAAPAKGKAKDCMFCMCLRITSARPRPHRIMQRVLGHDCTLYIDIMHAQFDMRFALGFFCGPAPAEIVGSRCEDAVANRGPRQWSASRTRTPAIRMTMSVTISRPCDSSLLYTWESQGHAIPDELLEQ